MIPDSLEWIWDEKSNNSQIWMLCKEFGKTARWKNVMQFLIQLRPNYEIVRANTLKRNVTSRDGFCFECYCERRLGWLLKLHCKERKKSNQCSWLAETKNENVLISKVQCHEDFVHSCLTARRIFVFIVKNQAILLVSAEIVLKEMINKGQITKHIMLHLKGKIWKHDQRFIIRNPPI